MKKEIVAACIVLLFLFTCITGCSNKTTSDTDNTNMVNGNTVAGSQDKVSDDDSVSANKSNEKNTIKISLNKPFSTDWMTVTFSSIYTSFDLEPSDTSDYYSYYEGTKGNQFFIVDGTFKNVGTFSVGPDNSLAKIVFDDKYEYSAQIYNEQNNRLNTLYSIDPFQSVRLVIAAQIPDELLKQYHSVKVQWGVTDYFSYNSNNRYTYVTSWNDITTIYELTATK